MNRQKFVDDVMSIYKSGKMIPARKSYHFNYGDKTCGCAIGAAAKYNNMSENIVDLGRVVGLNYNLNAAYMAGIIAGFDNLDLEYMWNPNENFQDWKDGREDAQKIVSLLKEQNIQFQE